MWILLLFLGNARSQKLVVDDFSMSFNDLTPSIQNVKDLNDVPCALIKIWLVDEITRVEGIYVGNLIDRGLYYFGYGVEKDYKEAARLFEISAKGRYNRAQYNIAVYYEDCIGVGKKQQIADYWYEQAKKNGYE